MTSLQQHEVDQIIMKAFKSWQEVSGLQLQKADDIFQFPVIYMNFLMRNHLDYSFDWEENHENTYAHAYLPYIGEIHFDDEEVWGREGEAGKETYISAELHI